MILLMILWFVITRRQRQSKSRWMRAGDSKERVTSASHIIGMTRSRTDEWIEGKSWGLMPFRVTTSINSCGWIAFSSIAVHGRHMQSTGARVTICKHGGRKRFPGEIKKSPRLVSWLITFRNLGTCFGQKRPVVASRSPVSWQHIQERSTCQNLEPETWDTIELVEKGSCETSLLMSEHYSPERKMNIDLGMRNWELIWVHSLDTWEDEWSVECGSCSCYHPWWHSVLITCSSHSVTRECDLSDHWVMSMIQSAC